VSVESHGGRHLELSVAACCHVIKAAGYDPPSPAARSEPRRLARVGVRFCDAARDRCARVALTEFLRVAAREIPVRDRLD
jgi:hypothetical protein